MKKQPVRKSTSLISVLIIALVLIAARFFFSSEDTVITDIPDGSCTFQFIDVGQGDASLFVSADGAVMIDTGSHSCSDKTADYVLSQINAIDYLVLTHPDEDHIGGAADIIGKIEVKNIIMSDAVKDTATFTSLLDTIEDRKVNVIKAVAGDSYTVGDIKCTVLSPISEFDGNYNDYSVVMRIEYGKSSVIVTGDAEQNAEREMIAKYSKKLNADILKLAHHGSSTSTSESFFNAVSPDIAVISCGKSNSYGHPHEEILELLNKYGTTYYRTDESGTIVFVSDGVNIEKK